MTIPMGDVFAVLTAVMPFLLAAAGHLYQMLSASLPANQHSLLNQLATVVVNAVEQQSGPTANSAQKKAQAVASLSKLAQDMGLGRFINANVIDLAIEFAVSEMNAGKPQTVAMATSAL